MPARVRVFIGAACAAAALLLTASALLYGFDGGWSWWGVGLLLLGCILGEAGASEISRDSAGAGYVVSVASIPHLASALLVPPAMAAALAGLAMLLDELRARSPLPRTFFNVASTTTSVGAAALLATASGLAGDKLGDGEWQQVPVF